MSVTPKRQDGDDDVLRDAGWEQVFSGSSGGAQGEPGHIRGLVQSGTFDRCSTWNRLIGATAEQFVLLLQQLFDFSQLAKLIGPLFHRISKRGLARLRRGA